LIVSADGALYEAKRLGRDRVARASGGPTKVANAGRRAPAKAPVKASAKNTAKTEKKAAPKRAKKSKKAKKEVVA
jgi:hypothetical protein